MNEDGNQRSSGGGIKKGSKRLTPFHQPFKKIIIPVSNRSKVKL